MTGRKGILPHGTIFAARPRSSLPVHRLPILRRHRLRDRYHAPALILEVRAKGGQTGGRPTSKTFAPITWLHPATTSDAATTPMEQQAAKASPVRRRQVHELAA